MLKREFYDIMTVVAFVLVISISILLSGITSSKLFEGNINPAINAMLLLQLIIGAIVFIYWLFILLMAINLYTKESLIIVDVILTAMLIPFSPIVYLILLRKPLRDSKEYNPKIKKNIGNVPGTP